MANVETNEGGRVNEGVGIAFSEVGGAASIQGISLAVDLSNAGQRRSRRRQVLNLASIQELAENGSQLEESPVAGTDGAIQSDQEVECEIRATLEVGAALGLELPPNSEVILRDLIQSEKKDVPIALGEDMVR